MKQIFSFWSAVFLVGSVLLAGCSPDHSSDTREVSTPNPPQRMPSKEDFQPANGAPATSGDQISSNPSIPKETRDKLSHVIPGAPNSK